MSEEAGSVSGAAPGAGRVAAAARARPSWDAEMPRSSVAQGRKLLLRADVDAERLVSYVRIATAAIVYLALSLIVDREDFHAPDSAMMLWTAQVSLGVLFLSGVIALAAVELGRWRPWMVYVTATVDSGVVLANLAMELASTRISGDFISAFPAATAIPLILVTSIVRMRPAVQIYISALMMAGVLIIAFMAGHTPYDDRLPLVGPLAPVFGENANSVRLLAMACMSVVLCLAAARGRALLLKAVDETRRRMNLGRYLPSELSHILETRSIEDLRAGSRKRVGLLFVDIRNSTSMEESLDAHDLSALINDFRNHLTRIAQRHDAIIDKFIGDGAFLVCGLIETGADDAARTIACAIEIIEAMDQWSRKRLRLGEPAVRVGAGVHFGEAFVGAIGNEDRLEFTVLGDAVNVAARLEQATKTCRTPLLVSRDALEAAGHTDAAGLANYRYIGLEPLRGRQQPVPVYAPLATDKLAAAQHIGDREPPVV